MGKFGGFQSVKLTKPQRSTFDLSHEKRMSVSPSFLTPILVTECLPSDKFNGSSEVLVRLAPLLAPIYEQVSVFVHFFFVPNRLLWGEWESFITGGRLGPESFIDPDASPIPPYWNIGDLLDAFPAAFNKHSLSDYLGVPILLDLPPGFVASDYDGIELDAMPYLAYTKIWLDYYRDRNFTDDVIEQNLPAASGVLDGSVYYSYFAQIRQRLYKKDYFTSALPFTQRGDEVLLPVDVRVTQALQESTGLPTGVAGTLDFDNVGTIRLDMGGSPVTVDGVLVGTNAASTINDFRSAYALQVWMERNAVGGSRYTESTQAHFGIRPQDARLQRAEYIGGGKINVKISEVVSTAYSTNADTDTVPLGNLGGHGVTFGNTNQFNYFCMEHGFIMGILSIMSPPSYHQGLPRMFRRRSFLDYPWPTFAKLGEQEVANFELYATPLNLTEDAQGEYPSFGYQSRYAEWKYLPTRNHGDFHDTLLFWTGTLDFDATPELGLSFLEPQSSTFNRWFVVDNDSNNFWLYIHNRVFVKRPLPYFGTPNTLGFV